MSLFMKKALKDAALGIWEINEDVEELYASLSLSEKEKQYFSFLKSPQRKQHWLSYRLILPYLVGDTDMLTIEYDEFGKPHLNNGIRHISVAHSGKFSALIASPSKSVGIDIEKISKKIFDVSHKFLNNKELSHLLTEQAKESLCLIWAAKEALYKLYGRRDLLFREHIRIFPFQFEGKGNIYGEIQTDDFYRCYKVYYEVIEEYLLVYAIDR